MKVGNRLTPDIPVTCKRSDDVVFSPVYNIQIRRTLPMSRSQHLFFFFLLSPLGACMYIVCTRNIYLFLFIFVSLYHELLLLSFTVHAYFGATLSRLTRIKKKYTCI